VPRRAVTLALLLLLALAACGDGEERTGTSARTGETAPAQPAGTEPERTAAGCEVVDQPQPREAEERRRPRGRLDRDKRHLAVVDTNCGTFTIELATGRAPRTTASFAALARDRFFDGLPFHRIVPEFVIQGGDPNGNGSGGPGYEVVEAPPEGVAYPKYTVAMAKADVDAPGTSGSQFFVVTTDRAPLEPIYALLGRVVEGREVVDRLAGLPTDPALQQPLEPAVIESVRIREVDRPRRRGRSR
jgi:peptidyl-prolyl cis-trans isomerase B (cyclophilin B)